MTLPQDPHANAAIGRRIRLALLVLKPHRNQENAARDIGVSKQRMNGWLQGGGKPNLSEHLPALVRYLDVTEEWIYFGKSASLKRVIYDRLAAAVADASDDEWQLIFVDAFRPASPGTIAATESLGAKAD